MALLTVAGSDLVMADDPPVRAERGEIAAAIETAVADLGARGFPAIEDSAFVTAVRIESVEVFGRTTERPEESVGWRLSSQAVGSELTNGAHRITGWDGVPRAVDEVLGRADLDQAVAGMRLAPGGAKMSSRYPRFPPGEATRIASLWRIGRREEAIDFVAALFADESTLGWAAGEIGLTPGRFADASRLRPADVVGPLLVSDWLSQRLGLAVGLVQDGEDRAALAEVESITAAAAGLEGPVYAFLDELPDFHADLLRRREAGFPAVRDPTFISRRESVPHDSPLRGESVTALIDAFADLRKWPDVLCGDDIPAPMAELLRRRRESVGPLFDCIRGDRRYTRICDGCGVRCRPPVRVRDLATLTLVEMFGIPAWGFDFSTADATLSAHWERIRDMPAAQWPLVMLTDETRGMTSWVEAAYRLTSLDPVSGLPVGHRLRESRPGLVRDLINRRFEAAIHDSFLWHSARLAVAMTRWDPASSPPLARRCFAEAVDRLGDDLPGRPFDTNTRIAGQMAAATAAVGDRSLVGPFDRLVRRGIANGEPLGDARFILSAITIDPEAYAETARHLFADPASPVAAAYGVGVDHDRPVDADALTAARSVARFFMVETDWDGRPLRRPPWLAVPEFRELLGTHLADRRPAGRIVRVADQVEAWRPHFVDGPQVSVVRFELPAEDYRVVLDDFADVPIGTAIDIRVADLVAFDAQCYQPVRQFFPLFGTVAERDAAIEAFVDDIDAGAVAAP
ncbi:MAG: hypothetical protein AAF532_14080 [Planctomycetota bacterium]